MLKSKPLTKRDILFESLSKMSSFENFNEVYINRISLSGVIIDKLPIMDGEIIGYKFELYHRFDKFGVDITYWIAVYGLEVFDWESIKNFEIGDFVIFFGFIEHTLNKPLKYKSLGMDQSIVDVYWEFASLIKRNFIAINNLEAGKCLQE